MRADEDEGVALIEPNAGRTGLKGVDQADEADDRSRVDVPPGALVVERDIAADDRHAERPAGFGQPVDRLGQLPHDFWVLRVAEVEAVDCSDGHCSCAGEIEERLGDGEGGAGPGVDCAPEGIGVTSEGEPLAGPRDPRRRELQDRGVGLTGATHGI